MSDTEKLRWRERSAHADHVWREKGLSGDEAGAVGSIVRLLDAYRGDQWRHIGLLGGVDSDAHLVVNSMFSAANTMEAHLLARLPRVTVFGKTTAAAAKSRSFEHLMNWAITEVKAERAWNAALRDAFFRFGIVRAGYTPHDEMFAKDGSQVEFGSPTTADLPWLRRVAPWDIRIDPLAESWHADGDATWCEFISLYTLDMLKAMPGITVPRDLVPTISKDKRTIDERRREDRYTYEAANLVEVRTVYDLSERKWFQWSVGSDRLLREPADWPEVFRGLEGLPYSLLAFNEPSDDACPMGYADMVWPLQVERNKVRTMLSELVRRYRRVIVANKSAFNDDTERTKLSDGEIAEVFWVNGDVSQAVRDIPLAGFDQGLLLYDQVIQEDIREVIGQSKMSRAQRINVETATEAARVGAGDDLQAGRNQIRVEAWLRDSVRLMAKCIQALPDAEWVIPVLGQQDAGALMASQPAVLQLSTDEIQGEYLFDIEVGSTLPRNDRQEIAKEMAWLQVAQQFPKNINVPAALVSLAIAMDKDPSTALMNAQQVAATDAAAEGPGTPAESGPGSINPAPFLAPGGGAMQ
jgi:hypothetical protein